MGIGRVKLAAISSGVAGLMVGGVLMASMPAFAGTSTGTTNPAKSSSTSWTNHGKYHPNWSQRLLHENADQIASDLHITKAQLVQDLVSGKSLDDVAATSNVSQAALQNDLQTMVQSDLQRMVTHGHMTTTREAKLMKRLDAQLPKVMANTHLIHKPMRFNAAMNVLNYVATQLHMTRAELVSQLRGGKSIAQIATAQGVSASTLQTAVTQKLDTQVNSKVQKMFNKTNWFQKTSSASTTQTN